MVIILASPCVGEDISSQAEGLRLSQSSLILDVVGQHGSAPPARGLPDAHLSPAFLYLNPDTR